ncbi:hypothetical protein CEQ36_21965 [Yersinia intermedia]|nr:hypothetical protein A6J67_09175 [Yersinia sp. FDAARGOS_228]AVL37966.1 hypothetical protein CEQ36_21965 [Yersinia intermedia]OVZ75265.1 hypothetical protein CBW55_11075 [Yersinia intermedia]OWF89892.1 hypothetical protein B4916_17190 [Yersinia intermedia]
MSPPGRGIVRILEHGFHDWKGVGATLLFQLIKSRPFLHRINSLATGKNLIRSEEIGNFTLS